MLVARSAERHVSPLAGLFYHFFIVMIFMLSDCNSNTQVSKNSVSDAGELRRLSDYCTSLKDTHGDTIVYVLDSGKPGANILLIAGTHGNEIAGIYAAELFVSLASVENGRVFVIPRLNSSGIPTGSRFVKIEHQGQNDPDWYVPPEGTTRYRGIEQRNINRSYPGSLTEGLTQKIAEAVMNLLVLENIDIAIDMHEAEPSSNIAWTIISNPKNVNVAVLAVLDLEEKGIPMRLDVSPPDMDGLSHKEWGNRTNAMSFLIETANPAQADNPSTDMLNDPNYALERRASIQLETIQSIVSQANLVLPLPLLYSGIPNYDQ
jgi:predicted deacylase